MEGFPYRGHFIRLHPEERQGRWEAMVAIDVHAKGERERIYYRDHLNSYASREEAVEGCKEFGRRMVDTFTVPGVGEGDYRETGC